MAHTIRQFASSYSGRMLLGTLFIHALLIPILFVGILHLAEKDYQAQFVNHARAQSYLLATLMDQTGDPTAISRIADDLVMSGQVAYAGYISPSGKTYLSSYNQTEQFREDFFFGGHDDHIYFINIPSHHAEGGMLHVGFDEAPTEEHIRTSYMLGIGLALGYIVLTALFIGFFGHRMTKSIRQLRDVSRKIASGQTGERISVDSGVTEVFSLAKDLEAMRKELVQRGDEIALREARQRAVLETAAEGIIIVDPQGRIESFNKAAEVIFCYSIDEIIHKPFTSLLTPEDAEKFLAPSGEPLIGVGTELRGLRNCGEAFHLTLSVSEANAAGSRCFTILVQDNSERHAFEAKLTHLATHDALTGLPNRALFNDRLAQVLAHASRDDHTVAILFLDLDRFKHINDTLGHNIGDQLLQAVSDLLKNCLRGEDTLARLGGDEFTLILPHLGNTDGAATVAQNILSVLEQPFSIAGQELFISGSIGIAYYPHDGSEASELVKNADTAMYAAKSLGGNNFQFYSQHMNAMASARFEMEKMLRHALERNELQLHYQPQVNSRSQRIVGVEALLRWHQPDLGWVSPSDFIPLAEETGLIIPISDWVLRTACAQCKDWLGKGYDLTVAVNLCARQFTQSDLLLQISDILKQTELDPKYLELELTESMVMQQGEETIAILHQLKGLGLRLSLDDFGTGYSSLSYLRRFPIDTLKIDRSFIQDISSDPDDGVLASAIIAMAHSLKMDVIGEGVETAEQVGYLHAHRCDTFQGFYFSKPLSGEAMTELLHTEPAAQQQAGDWMPLMAGAQVS
ncbi:MAG: EAL domain-containing protein [Sulfuricella sp.]